MKGDVKVIVSGSSGHIVLDEKSLIKRILMYVISAILGFGALFLAFIAIVPIIFSGVTGMHGLMMGGTSVIILVGVALETGRQLESQMMVRKTKGFLDK